MIGLQRLLTTLFLFCFTRTNDSFYVPTNMTQKEFDSLISNLTYPFVYGNWNSDNYFFYYFSDMPEFQKNHNHFLYEAELPGDMQKNTSKILVNKTDTASYLFEYSNTTKFADQITIFFGTYLNEVRVKFSQSCVFPILLASSSLNGLDNQGKIISLKAAAGWLIMNDSMTFEVLGDRNAMFTDIDYVEFFVGYLNGTKDSAKKFGIYDQKISFSDPKNITFLQIYCPIVDSVNMTWSFDIEAKITYSVESSSGPTPNPTPTPAPNNTLDPTSKSNPYPLPGSNNTGIYDDSQKAGDDSKVALGVGLGVGLGGGIIVLSIIGLVVYYCCCRYSQVSRPIVNEQVSEPNSKSRQTSDLNSNTNMAIDPNSNFVQVGTQNPYIQQAQNFDDPQENFYAQVYQDRSEKRPLNIPNTETMETQVGQNMTPIIVIQRLDEGQNNDA